MLWPEKVRMRTRSVALMTSMNSTTIVLVGTEMQSILLTLNSLINVRASSLDNFSDDEAQRWVARSHSPYVVHDRDPLGHIAAAWVGFFDDRCSIATLDLEVDRTLMFLERGEREMPDYYIVVNPEELAPTWKHWWLGVLPQAAPTRVIPWQSVSTPLTGVLRHLPTGRPWPTPGPWLREVARTVPDRVGTGSLASVGPPVEGLVDRADGRFDFS